VIDKSFVLGKCKKFRVEAPYTGNQVVRGVYDFPMQSVSVDKDKEKDGKHYKMVSKDKTLLYFEGTNPILGCTILLSGNRDFDEKELQDVKSALRDMLRLARNVVLERAFLDQINFQVPRPLHDERGNLIPANSPFLITKNIKNRSILVLNKVIMKKGVGNINQ
jgi:hypothetical protein